MKIIDPADPDSPVPSFESMDSDWYRSMSQQEREYRAWMYAREITLSRELLKRVDAGIMTPMEFSYRLTRLGVHDVKGLCRLQMESAIPCPIHEFCWQKGEGHE